MERIKCAECGEDFPPSEMTDVEGAVMCDQCAAEVLEGMTGVIIARYLCKNCLQSFDATELMELDGEYFCESCRKRRADFRGGE